MAAETHQCPSCGTYQQGILSFAVLVLCRQCNSPVVDRTSQRVPPQPPPEDWTFIRIGSTGIIDKEQFAVVGRVRLQLTNNYKNIWTVALKTGTAMLLVESFGSFTLLAAEWRKFDKETSKLRAGKSVPVNGSKYHGEYLEKCVAISYEGENVLWQHFKKGFFVFQCSDEKWNTAFFPFEAQKPVTYLAGKKTKLQDLQFTNIVTWDEWK